MSFIGNLGYTFYYKPKGWLKKIIKNGLFNSVSIEQGRQAMVKTSASLKIAEPATDAAEVYFLTGKKFWPLTAFCMYSLSKQSGNKLRAVFIDDGSLDDALIKTMRLQFPGCNVKTSAQIEADIKTYLPTSKYPVINKKRAVYPHLKKLTDVHAGSKGWKLVLDSDMLFFKYPVEMLTWLDAPQQPFFLYDPVYSYHYSLALMEQFANNTIIPNLNVGAIGLKSELVDWDKLETWIAQLEEKEGTNYLLEQALSAMLVAGDEPIIADRQEYIVMPERSEVENPSATLHHYVAGSKEWYYKKAWQQVI